MVQAHNSCELNVFVFFLFFLCWAAAAGSTKEIDEKGENIQRLLQLRERKNEWLKTFWHQLLFSPIKLRDKEKEWRHLKEKALGKEKCKTHEPQWRVRVSHVSALPLYLCSLQAAVSSAACQPFQSARSPVPEQGGKPKPLFSMQFEFTAVSITN